jgi:benzoate-CoA ligase
MERYPFNYARYIFEHTRLNSDSVAFVDSQGALTYQQWQFESEKFAAVLTDCGIRSNNYVVVCVKTTKQFPVLFFACLLQGIVPVLLEPDSGPELIARFVDKLQASAVITDGEHDYKISITKYCNKNSTIIKDYEYQPDDYAFVITSSGTTGDPKLVRHRHKILFDIWNTAKISDYKLNSNSVIMSTAKLNYGWGLGNALIISPNAHATAVINDKVITPALIESAVAHHGVTHLFSSPVIYKLLLQKSKLKLSPSLTHCICASEPLSNLLEQKFEEKFNRPILNTYGSSEMFWIVTGNSIEQKKFGSIGKLFSGFTTKIVNEQGAICQPLEPGMLYVKTDMTCNGYVPVDGVDNSVFDNGWFKTNDIVYCDSDGFYFFVNRQGQFVKINANWVSAQEIENLLLSTGKVDECTVVFGKDEYGLIEAMAYVVASQGVTISAAELRSQLLSSSQSHKVPKKIYFLNSIPRTNRNKKVISPQVLEQIYADAL